jgi:hypothetical protein
MDNSSSGNESQTSLHVSYPQRELSLGTSFSVASFSYESGEFALNFGTSRAGLILVEVVTSLIGVLSCIFLELVDEP